MTKKLAELSGSVSVISASLILVLAFLITSIPAPVMPAFYKTPVFAEEVSSGEARKNAEGTKTAPIPAQEDLMAKASDVFTVNKASFQSRVFGLSQSEKRDSSSHLVLATSQSLPNFAVTATVSPEEYALLLYCVEHETRSGSLPHKALITQVILNRVQGAKFPFTVKEVILAPGQFDPMANYEGWGTWQPDPSTVEAVDYVLSGYCPDYSQGALYFCNPYLVGEENWFDMTRQAVCEIEGHRFYK